MKPDSTQYHGVRLHTGAHVTRTAGGRTEALDPATSFALRDKYPDRLGWGNVPAEFNWGFGGVGAAQLALAILLDWTEDEKTALLLFPEFKWGVVAAMRDPSFHLSGQEIRRWLVTQRADVVLPEIGRVRELTPEEDKAESAESGGGDA